MNAQTKIDTKTETGKKPLVVLTGPTAVGKTSLSIRLAKEIRGSIISADSMQVYKDMDIGTDKITPAKMQGIPHYLIDVLEPEDDFNVVLFQKLAKQAMAEIYEQGRIPILVGGTGFYIQSVVYDIDFTEEDSSPEVREKLEQTAEEKGDHYLHEKLEEVDPQAASEIHENNRKRMIRALEFHALTGERISDHNRKQRQKPSPYNFCYFVLTDRRDLLYEKIEERVDRMLDRGLVNEVRGLRERGLDSSFVSMQGLGYKEIMHFLDGDCSLKEAERLIKRNTRHFAKRQLTWFRRERDVIWMDKNAYSYDDNRMLSTMLQILREKDIVP